ncbi:hypothetical protein COV61_02280 [Candidatus Micrarchaeota archaeon CG11_big_fil_rev_8_21_14_0_20_47_5]|nr:MAG: hypothetical protein AUJ17_04150 [Candidatus Micrarchaeota archaeon CG1_02_47_40]PIN83735.1 MAG: hypothetical protein COV61_02280 [Candidatus Micrarchaeota archaeon CG11_big_fil_rev_8_21_14_0_20_47_5]QBM01428.1 hypothetical protein [uncultured archaeon]
MSSSLIAKVDERGRLIIPASFREILNIAENSSVLLTLNTEKKALAVLPFASAGERLYSVRLALSDAPGSLSKVLLLLASEGVDLVQSESVASERGRKALWKAVVEMKYCKRSAVEMKKLLAKEKAASEIEFERI